MLDYYLIGSQTLVVEEFAVDTQGCTTGLDSTAYAAQQRSWVATDAFSRALRGDIRMREATTALTRRQAEQAVAAWGYGRLDSEDELRNRWAQRWEFPVAAPLRLTPGHSDERRYRLLFANGLAGLASGEAGRDGSVFSWQAREVGGGLAWAVDVTVRVGEGAQESIGEMLNAGRRSLRRKGLIPVCVERLA